MKKQKTRKQCNDLADALEKIKPRITSFSFFRDNHHEAIDTQVKILRREMSAEDLEDAFENEDITDSIYEAGNRVIDWMDGTTDDDILAEWKELEKK